MNIIEQIKKSFELHEQGYSLRWINFYPLLPNGSASAIRVPARLTPTAGQYVISKIAISNYRLLNLSDGMVAFTYRDRATGDIKKVMSLPVKEFLFRFKQHILPRGFVKIRHYGLFGTRVKKEKLARVRKALGQRQKEKKKKRSLAEVVLETTQENIHRCRSCREGTILVIKVLPKVRGSPGNSTLQQNKY